MEGPHFLYARKANCSDNIKNVRRNHAEVSRAGDQATGIFFIPGLMCGLSGLHLRECNDDIDRNVWRF